MVMTSGSRHWRPVQTFTAGPIAPVLTPGSGGSRGGVPPARTFLWPKIFSISCAFRKIWQNYMLAPPRRVGIPPGILDPPQSGGGVLILLEYFLVTDCKGRSCFQKGGGGMMSLSVWSHVPSGWRYDVTSCLVPCSFQGFPSTGERETHGELHPVVQQSVRILLECIFV